MRREEHEKGKDNCLCLFGLLKMFDEIRSERISHIASLPMPPNRSLFGKVVLGRIRSTTYNPLGRPLRNEIFLFLVLAKQQRTVYVGNVRRIKLPKRNMENITTYK